VKARSYLICRPQAASNIINFQLSPSKNLPKTGEIWYN